MRLLLFSDIHFHHTHRFSHITTDGYTTRELEHLSCADTIIKLCKANDVDRIVFCGDLYGPVGDSLSTQTQTAVCEFVDRIRQVCPVDMLVGNHDMNSSTNNQYTHKLIPFKYWDNVIVYDKPTVINECFVYMPYCISDEYATSVLENIQDKENKIVFSHLELSGINLGNGIETTHGVPLSLLQQFKVTFQGHYHSGTKYGSNIHIIGSTQRLSFKDPGKSKNNIILYDTVNNTIDRCSFDCPDWLSFTDDNIDDILSIPLNNYVKVDISTDMLLTDEIKNRLDLFKGKDIHIDLNRISFDESSIKSNIEETSNDDELSVIKQFVNKAEADENYKKLLLDEGVRLLDKAKI